MVATGRSHEFPMNLLALLGQQTFWVTRVGHAQQAAAPSDLTVHGHPVVAGDHGPHMVHLTPTRAVALASGSLVKKTVRS